MPASALALLWFALSGGYAGINQPGLLAINGGIGLALGVGAAVIRRKMDLVQWGMLAAAAAALVSGLLAQTLVIKAAQWLILGAVYRLSPGWPVSRAARWALAGYLPLALLLPENTNVLAFNLVALLLLALPARGSVYLLPPVVMAVVWLNSFGGLIALALGVSIYALRFFRRSLLWAGLAGAPAAVGWLFTPDSYLWRLRFWADAWRGFLSAPLAGLGPWQFWRLDGWCHGHNLVMTTAAEGGLLGLAALGLLLGAVAKQWPRLTGGGQAVIAALLAWSLIDEPLLFFAPGVIFALALNQKQEVTS